MAVTKYYVYSNTFDLNRFKEECASGKNGIWAVQTPEPDLTLRGVVFPSWQRFVFNFAYGIAAITGYDLFDIGVNDTIDQVKQTFQKYSIGDIAFNGAFS